VFPTGTEPKAPRTFPVCSCLILSDLGGPRLTPWISRFSLTLRRCPKGGTMIVAKGDRHFYQVISEPHDKVQCRAVGG
jgi:hypothetical protein